MPPHYIKTKEVIPIETIFKRLEKKFILNKHQLTSFKKLINNHMQADAFGHYNVLNIYYDTPNWDIAKLQLEKPIYREKLRMRCYNSNNKNSDMFLELKKKYKGVSYKRRTYISDYANSTFTLNEKKQIDKEIDYYINTNQVSERMFIGYSREAYAGIQDPNLRLTLDTNICYRTHDLNFNDVTNGTKILAHDQTLLEVKIGGAFPLWLAKFLSENQLYANSFSKFANSYLHMNQHNTKDTNNNDAISNEPTPLLYAVV